MSAPLALIVLDGWGHSQDATNNAIAQADTPNMDGYWRNHPHCLLEASGPAVGLPHGQIGNSEIGHTTIGAGTVLDTDLVRITKAIESGTFNSTPAFKGLFSWVKKHNSCLHIFGLVSPGGIHSHHDHLIAFLRAARSAGVQRIAIHAFTDGRDVPPTSAQQYLEELEGVVAEIGGTHIATLSGRYYGMDRDGNWDRVEQVMRPVLTGIGKESTQSASALLLEHYATGGIDEHLQPQIILDDQGNKWILGKQDGVFLANFRSDRVRMVTQRLLQERDALQLQIVSMTEFAKEFVVDVAFPPKHSGTTLAEQVSLAGLTQVHIAETEKFPHATYFLNGGKEDTHLGEEHIMLASRKDVATHDLAPEMRAEGIADAALEAIGRGTDFLFINFANPDMVGHTANVPAIQKAVEVVDTQLARVVDALLAMGGQAIVTADHGNAELNIDTSTGEKHTAHTLNPVPCILVGGTTSLHHGSLQDLAPTALALLGLRIPASMTGRPLTD
jgi:2,3-bisphosphoglycerate-independent phosphoglycerate mutase